MALQRPGNPPVWAKWRNNRRDRPRAPPVACWHIEKRCLTRWCDPCTSINFPKRDNGYADGANIFRDCFDNPSRLEEGLTVLTVEPVSAVEQIDRKSVV